MKTMLENVRLAFPVMWEPEPFSAGDDPMFGLQAIFSKEDTALRAKCLAAMKDAAVAKWAAKWENASFRKSVKLCLYDGEEKDQYDGFDDTVWIVSTNANPKHNPRPTIIGRNREPLVAEDGKPYGGCYANVLVAFWAQDNSYGKRLNAQLCGVQFLRDGDRFGGGESASAEDFDALGADENESGEGVATMEGADMEDPLG